ncbi:MAG: TA system VapC family ribonuclease toxin [Verrucomicrobiales bacterium]
MILPDVNLLVYASDLLSPHHQQALTWWNESAASGETIGIAEFVVMGFLRITTQPKFCHQPISLARAQAAVEAWFRAPGIQLLQPAPGHYLRVLRLLQQAGSTAGNLVSDAQLADLALEHGGTVHTNDRDFLRFAGLRWSFPLHGKKGRNPVI